MDALATLDEALTRVERVRDRLRAFAAFEATS
jgi:hypothetical protein